MNALISVTRATGFVGRAVVREFVSRAFNVWAVVRTVTLLLRRRLATLRTQLWVILIRTPIGRRR